MRTATAAATAALVLALGVAACSDDDDGGFPASLAEEARERGEAGGRGSGACRHLSPADLQEALGVRFEAGVDEPGSCTYRGARTPAAVTVNVADLPADAALALETSSATCDPGTPTDVAVEGATGSFACRLSDVAVVGGTSTTTYAVVLGSLGPDVDPVTLHAPLAGLLAQVLATADGGS